ncbi:Proton-transporting V-type ATPase complex assembly regulator TMEM9 [Halotydeus destructor]|nr:Proton-transporting V-type ATPase complex assembly regulator TMEM9 [Halotydeus destructor]
MSTVNVKYILSSVTLCVLIASSASQYHDSRCKCICPSPNVVTKQGENATVTKAGDKPDRSVYIGHVHPHECNCDGVVLPQLTPDVQGKAKEFCPRCECRYESRNTTTIRWVVTLIIGVIVCLVVYMGFLMLLDPLLHKGNRRSQYEEQVDDVTELDDQQSTVSSEGQELPNMAANTSRDSHRRNNVLDRVNFNQDKWKKKVEKQRENIYDKHTMLN